MPNSRSIPPQVWEHARQALVVFFTHRRGGDRAQDLAQQTLLLVWSREDYHFAQNEDFLRVCYGFASRVLMEDYRAEKRNPDGHDFELATAASARHGVHQTDAGVLLSEVCRIGRENLREEEWQLVMDSAAGDSAEQAPPVSNLLRVRLYRARRKLAELTGWNRKSRPDRNTA